MKRRGFLLTGLAAIATYKGTALAAPSGLDVPGISANEAAVVDGESGRLIWGKNAASPVYPASITKMATALVALERGKLDEKVIADFDQEDLIRRRSTMMGLTPGDEITLEDLLYGLLLPSGNDAAVAIGRYIASSDEGFVAMMNSLARRIGLRNTHFSNPHGLDSSWPDHLSTAADLAWLAREAMANPDFARIVATPARAVKMGAASAMMFNLNRLLGRYNGADGIKVGFTRRSGPALAASASRNGVRMIAVVLHSADPATDSARLLDWAFAVKRTGLPEPTGESDYPQPMAESWSRGLLP